MSDNWSWTSGPGRRRRRFREGDAGRSGIASTVSVRQLDVYWRSYGRRKILLQATNVRVRCVRVGAMVVDGELVAGVSTVPLGLLEMNLTEFRILTINSRYCHIGKKLKKVEKNGNLLGENENG